MRENSRIAQSSWDSPLTSRSRVARSPGVVRTRLRIFPPTLIPNLLVIALTFFAFMGTACAETLADGMGSSSPAFGGAGESATTFLLSLSLILFAAKAGGRISLKLGQPEVLGELGAGILLGNLSLVGLDSFSSLVRDQGLVLLGELGVIFLLFEIGLETKLSELRSIGFSAIAAATLGVVSPFLLGWCTVRLFYPAASGITAAFIGAILTATSVGITARVLRDLKKTDTPEARVILGAAVADDVLGLLALALMTNIVDAANRNIEVTVLPIVQSISMAVGFLVISIGLGKVIVPPLIRTIREMGGRDLEVVGALILCFLFAYLATRAGLAPLIGAFAAGIVLEGTGDSPDAAVQEPHLIELLSPLSLLCVPIFFVVMGLHVDLASFGGGRTLLFTVALTFAAIAGKQLCALGVVQRGIDRITIGVGMIPRGEVGLIFAGIGASLTLRGGPVVSREDFNAVVAMVIVTTVITPPLLARRFRILERLSKEKSTGNS